MWFILVAAILIGLLAAWRMAFVLGYAPSDPTTRMVNPEERQAASTSALPEPATARPTAPISSRGSRPGAAAPLPEPDADPDPAPKPAVGEGHRPALVVEVERQGREIVLRGTTNMTVEGGSVRARVYRIYRTADGDGSTGRAYLDRQPVPLVFEERLSADDSIWQASGRDRAGTPDPDKVMVELEFIGPRADPGPVPGLTVTGLSGDDRRLYRVVRTVPLPLDGTSPVGDGRASGSLETETMPVRSTGSGTGARARETVVTIEPLRSE